MKKLIILSITFLSIIFFTSCVKDTTGSIRFVNNSSNPYACYVDGALKTTLSGGYTYDVIVTQGTHTAEVIQQSGFLLYPTDETFTCTVPSGGSSTVSFP